MNYNVRHFQCLFMDSHLTDGWTVIEMLRISNITGAQCHNFEQTNITKESVLLRSLLPDVAKTLGAVEAHGLQPPVAKHLCHLMNN